MIFVKIVGIVYVYDIFIVDRHFFLSYTVAGYVLFTKNTLPKYFIVSLDMSSLLNPLIPKFSPSYHDRLLLL